MAALKKRGRFPSTIDNEYLEKLRELSDRTHIPISKLMDMALELLFEKHGVPIKGDKNESGDQD